MVNENLHEEEIVQLIDEMDRPVVPRSRSYSHSLSEQRTVLKWLLFIGIVASWACILFALGTAEWVRLDKSMSFLNKGEIHEFSLRLGLWEVEYSHTSLHRLNKASSVSLESSIDQACNGEISRDHQAVLDQAACGPVLDARYEAMIATILCLIIFGIGGTLLAPILTRVIHLRGQLTIIILLACASFALSLEARRNMLVLLTTCVIQDQIAQSKSFLGTSLADRACEQVSLGFAPLLLLLATSLHNVAVFAFRAQRLTWPSSRCSSSASTTTSKSPLPSIPKNDPIEYQQNKV